MVYIPQAGRFADACGELGNCILDHYFNDKKSQREPVLIGIHELLCKHETHITVEKA